MKVLTTLLADDRQLVVHDISMRVKTQASADRKIVRDPQRFATYGDIHDLLGVRVIMLFESDLDAAEEVIRQVLVVDPEKSGDKAFALAPNQFGYRSRHFVGKLAPSRASLPENQRFADQHVEIQLRSILQHAWAEIEHDLGYKPQRVVTPGERRRFSQLAACIELVDEAFSLLRAQLTAIPPDNLGVESHPQLDEGPPQSSLTVAELQQYVQTDPSYVTFENRLALALKAQLIPAGRTARQMAAYVADICSSVGWSTTTDLAQALTQWRAPALEKAARMTSVERNVLELSPGDGLRPGFGIIVLVAAMRASEKGT